MKAPKVKLDFVKIIIMTSVVTVFPLLVYHWLAVTTEVKILYSILCCFNCTVIIFEIVFAIFSKQQSLSEFKKGKKNFYFQPNVKPNNRFPRKISVIIAAYLPNEKDIIIECYVGPAYTRSQVSS